MGWDSPGSDATQKETRRGHLTGPTLTPEVTEGDEDPPQLQTNMKRKRSPRGVLTGGKQARVLRGSLNLHPGARTPQDYWEQYL